MFQDPLAGRAAVLIEDCPDGPAACADRAVWLEAAEDCVLLHLKSLRLLGGLPKHRAPLSADQRGRRVKDLLRLWAAGCTCAVDEDLFADLLNRASR